MQLMNYLSNKCNIQYIVSLTNSYGLIHISGIFPSSYTSASHLLVPEIPPFAGRMFLPRHGTF